MPQCGIYIMDADGSNVKLLVKDARRASLRRDGKCLVFERSGITITRNLATGEEFDARAALFRPGSWWPDFSPDGKRLLVASVGDTRGQTPPPPNLMATIFDLKADGRPAGQYWNVATGAMTLCPRWRPDGKGFVAVQGARETRLQAIRPGRKTKRARLARRQNYRPGHACGPLPPCFPRLQSHGPSTSRFP